MRLVCCPLWPPGIPTPAQPRANSNDFREGPAGEGGIDINGPNILNSSGHRALPHHGAICYVTQLIIAGEESPKAAIPGTCALHDSTLLRSRQTLTIDRGPHAARTN